MVQQSGVSSLGKLVGELINSSVTRGCFVEVLQGQVDACEF